MLRKIAIVIALSLLCGARLQAQVIVPAQSYQALLYQAEHCTDSVQHLAVEPYVQPIADTFYVEPLAEASNFFYTQSVQALATGGIRTVVKRKKLGFDARILTGLAIVPWQWQYPTVPQIGKALGKGLVKAVFDPQFTLSYQTKYLRFEAGREKFHLGLGYRSLWQDVYAPALPYIGGTAQVWRVLYSFRIAYLQNPDLRFADKTFFHAYNITHYFDFSFGRLNINLFETVIQDPIDSLGARRGFDFFNYLNPVVFLRAVDLALGSPDNVLLGLGGSLRLWKTTYLYGYGVLDELIVSHLLAGDKCWCLKYGLNAGVKTFALFGAKNLFAQTEASLVRPYTYSHDNPVLAYGNLYQPLAHPLGANFYEALTRTMYFSQNYAIGLKLIAAYFGNDIDSLNYGRNIFRSYLTRVSDLGVTIGQGQPVLWLFGSASFRKRFTSRLWLNLSVGNQVVKTDRLINKPFLSISLTSNTFELRNDWFGF